MGHALQPYQAPYDTLILREPDGTLSPMLATEWSYNEDRTQLTIDLRTDVTYSDGTKLTAANVVKNLDLYGKGDTNRALPVSEAINNYDHGEVVDDDIAALLAMHDVDDVAAAIVERVLAIGARDNLTAVVVEVVRGTDEPIDDTTNPRDPGEEER